MRAPARPYSDEELAALCKLYPTAPKADVQAALPIRTWRTIESTAKRLFLRRNVPLAREWSPAAEAILRQHYPTKGSQFVAAEVGRTPIAVYRHAIKLGISCDRSLNRWKFGEREYTQAERATITTHYATATRENLLAKLPRRNWDSIRKTASAMGLHRPMPPRLWQGVLLEQLRAHYPVEGAQYVADLVGLPVSTVRSAANRLGIKYVAKGSLPKPPKPPRVAKVKPKKVAKIKPPKPPKPIKEPVQKALPVPGVRERAVSTPNLNAQKARSIQAKQPRVVPITAEELRKLSYSDPRRMAHLRGGQQGYLDYMKQQQQAA